MRTLTQFAKKSGWPSGPVVIYANYPDPVPRSDVMTLIKTALSAAVLAGGLAAGMAIMYLTAVIVST